MNPLFYALLAVALGVLALLTIVYFKKAERSIKALSRQLSEAEQQLKIAEERFFTHKMNRAVFEGLLNDYKAQMLNIEMKMNRIQGKMKVNVKDRLKSLGSQIDNPTKLQIHKLESLLEEAECRVKELNFLNTKLMKHEIDESLFNNLAEEKHRKIIRTEAKIRNITKHARQKKEEEKEKFIEKLNEGTENQAP